MLLPVSALLFSLLSVELFTTIRKCTDEGYFAFLSPLITSSKQQVLSEKLEKLQKAKDTENIQVLLADFGIVKGTEQSLTELMTVESLIMENFENHFNRILPYLTEDLKRFFEALKVLWDVENLKLLMSYSFYGKGQEKRVHAVGPFGYIDPNSLELLAESKSVEELFEDSLKLFPTDFGRNINFEGKWSPDDLEIFLDLAAFEHLKQKSQEIGTSRVQRAWALLTEVYEVRNLIIMARLKYYATPSEDISRFLLPAQNRLSEFDISRLKQTEDYSSFLHVLQDTAYGKYIPTGEVEPINIEIALKEGLRRLKLEEAKEDFAAETFCCFLLDLETRYDTIRKAAFHTVIQGRDGG